MADYTPPTYMQYATNNRVQIQASEICHCVYCLQSYPPATITEYTDDDTAVCPLCYVDAVIPGNIDIQVTAQKLQEWHQEGFGI